MTVTLGAGTVVEVEPPGVPVLEMAPPQPTETLVLPVVGPRGLAGTGGSGNGAFIWTQTDPSTVWQFDHGLGYDPAGVHVEDETGVVHVPQVAWPQSGITVRLTFGMAVRGSARLS